MGRNRGRRNRLTPGPFLLERNAPIVHWSIAASSSTPMIDLAVKVGLNNTGHLCVLPSPIIKNSPSTTAQCAAIDRYFQERPKPDPN